MAMVEINLPVYRKKLAAGVREADAGIREMESMKQEVQNRISVDLQDQLYKLRNAERQMHLYNDVLVPKSLQTVEVTETAYSAAGADFLDLVEAERELLMFQESYFRSVADYGQALAKIEALVGAGPISGGEPLVGETPKTSPRTSPLSEGENSALER
jgi:outer membrane protein TolC